MIIVWMPRCSSNISIFQSDGIVPHLDVQNMRMYTARILFALVACSSICDIGCTHLAGVQNGRSLIMMYITS